MSGAEVSGELLRPASGTIHPSHSMRIGIITMLMAVIALGHNVLPMPQYPVSMVMIQKLFFLPVILAGFWMGAAGGLGAALFAALLYPHHGRLWIDEMPMFSVDQMTDILLLFMVGGVTGSLRNLYRRESLAHGRTAHMLDQSFERTRRSEHLAALGQMAAGVAHEVRNPLTGMQGAVDILWRTDDTHRRKAMLDRLEAEIGHLDAVTRSFLDFARPPETGMRSTSPHDVVRSAVGLAQVEVNYKGLEIHCDCKGDGSLLHDAEQLRRLTLNLILNAVAFSFANGVIRIESMLNDHEWHLLVANRGPAISLPERDRIFEPFYTTRPQGTGLGLAICARIADAHDGRILCDREGEWTVFSVRVPQSKAI